MILNNFGEEHNTLYDRDDILASLKYDVASSVQQGNCRITTHGFQQSKIHNHISEPAGSEFSYISSLILCPKNTKLQQIQMSQQQRKSSTPSDSLICPSNQNSIAISCVGPSDEPIVISSSNAQNSSQNSILSSKNVLQMSTHLQIGKKFLQENFQNYSKTIQDFVVSSVDNP